MNTTKSNVPFFVFVKIHRGGSFMKVPCTDNWPKLDNRPIIECDIWPKLDNRPMAEQNIWPRLYNRPIIEQDIWP